MHALIPSSAGYAPVPVVSPVVVVLPTVAAAGIRVAQLLLLVSTSTTLPPIGVPQKVSLEHSYFP
jgi:hypothetical protein